jgi:cob(I)alamin adenosyltransferase
VIHVYYGRGKGKTSAAMGAAIRAAGHGHPVLVAQFMKDARDLSGEVITLRSLVPALKVLRADLPYHIARPGPDHLPLLMERTRALLAEAREEVLSGRFRLVVLDELGIAASRGWLPKESLEDLVDRLPRGVELILTGRTMPAWLVQRADYVTRMTAIRHPYDRGVKARKGVEF